MAAVRLEASKVKIAKRMIEVLEFFGASYRPATVMDIARHYGRPQSSTSELLSSLVEVGLLSKDPVTREFKPTPRLATLGVSAQPAVIRDGRLFNYMDRLAKTTRKSVALFGSVATHVQIFRWLPAPYSPVGQAANGLAELLTTSTAGQLLLSTLDPSATKGFLWRLNAEARADERFDIPAMLERIDRFRSQGHATGTAGFIHDAQISAVLLPREISEPPLVLGILYPATEAQDADAYVATLRHGVDQVYSQDADAPPKVATPFMRAV